VEENSKEISEIQKIKRTPKNVENRWKVLDHKLCFQMMVILLPVGTNLIVF